MRRRVETMEYYQRANRIMDAGLQSSNLLTILDVGAEVMDAQLTLADRQMYPLGTTATSVADLLWEDLAEKALVPALNWMAMLEERAPLARRGGCTLYEWREPDDPRARFFVDIERSGKKLGYLSVVANSDREDPELPELVIVHAGVLAVQLESKSGHQAVNSVFEYYMVNLIENRFNSDDSGEELTAETGLKPEGFYTLVLVDIRRFDVGRRSLHAFRVAVEQSLHVTRSTIYEDRLILLLSAQSEQSAAERDYSLLDEQLKRNNTYAAVSRTFTSLWGLSTFYSGANKILNNCFCAPEGTRVLSAENMGIFFVVEALLRTERAEDLIDPRVRKLRAYDKKNGTEYMETLLVYLRCSRKPALVCRQLHIHRNTLDYRLQKIVDLTDIDWSNGDLCFRLYLSLNAMLYIKLKDSFADHLES